MNSPAKSTSSIVHLKAGQSLWQYLSQGSVVIICNQGMVEVKTQLYQADILTPLIIKTNGNSPLMIEFSQLYEIKALADTQIQLKLPESQATKILCINKILTPIFLRIKNRLNINFTKVR
jgi:hypothetical protein